MAKARTKPAAAGPALELREGPIAASLGMSRRPSPALTPDEVEIAGRVVLARPREWWVRAWRAYAAASRQVTRAEFNAACDGALQAVAGKTMFQEDAAKKFRRIVEALTGAQAAALMTKCDVSENAVVVCYLGHASSGFFYARHLTLKDPAEARRG